jgi:cytochrome c-type biogenesis protein CcmH/NrfG
MSEPLTAVRARALLRDGELALAIAAFLDALEQHPDHLESYFGLAEAYETTYEVLPDPELLHQVRNVLAALADQDPGPDLEARAGVIATRIAEKLAAAGNPPPAPGRSGPT